MEQNNIQEIQKSFLNSLYELRENLHSELQKIKVLF